MAFNWESFTYDADWLQAAVTLEAEPQCDIQIGGTGTTPKAAIDNTQLQSQLKQVRLQSLLFRKLRLLLQDSHLGVGTDAAITEGRRLVRAKLQQLRPEQYQHFEALITEDALAAQDYPYSAQVRQALCSLLEQAEWEQIAHAATQTLQSRFFEQLALG